MAKIQSHGQILHVQITRAFDSHNPKIDATQVSGLLV